MTSSEMETDNSSFKKYHILPMITLQAIACTLTVISLLLTVGRYVQHWRIARHFYLDDIFLAIAMIFLIPFTAGTLLVASIHVRLLGIKTGDAETMPRPEEVSSALKMEVACTIFLWLIIYAAKANFLVIYWRTLCDQRNVRIVCIALTIIVGLFFGIIFMSIFWVCGTPAGIGNPEACGSIQVDQAISIFAIWSGLNLSDSLLMILFPLICTMLQGERPSNRHCILIAVIMCLTFFFFSLDILRTYWNLTISLGETTNTLFLWKLLEASVAVIVAATSGYMNSIDDRSSVAEIDHDWIEIRSIDKKNAA